MAIVPIPEKPILPVVPSQTDRAGMRFDQDLIRMLYDQLAVTARRANASVWLDPGDVQSAGKLVEFVGTANKVQASSFDVDNPVVDGITVGAAGVTFPSGTLSDYETGTWTPTVRLGGNSTGMTYGAVRTGRYAKIGNFVQIDFDVLLAAKGSSTGSVTIEGLPYAVSQVPITVSIDQGTTINGGIPIGLLFTSPNSVGLYNTGTTGRTIPLNDGNINNTSRFRGAGSFVLP